MKINNINSIPVFINRYSESNYDLFTSIYDFCTYILNIPYESKVKNNKQIYEFKIKNNFIVEKIVNFYNSKSNLDCKLNCKYEDELGIPKSISNEVFKAEVNGNEIELIIDSYDNETLIMIQL